VAAGDAHTIARRSDGSAIAWGLNFSGQCNVPPPPPGATYVQVAAAWGHSMARFSDGSAAAWGLNAAGQCNVPALPPGQTYVSVYAGYGHSLARRSDGSLLAWGDDSSGQTQVPLPPPGLTYVEASASSHSIARLSDGSVLGWGYNGFGQCDPLPLAAGLTYAVPFAGPEATVALVERSATPPAVYCTAKVNSLGCTPAISVVGIPSASFGNGCTLRTRNLVGAQTGLYFHSASGAQSTPFHGGFLCVSSPVRRHAPLSSGGAAGSCSGFLAEDFNAYLAGGTDPLLVPGATVCIQAWSSDAGDPFGDSLSDALALIVSP
jgi:hypothetical protein